MALFGNRKQDMVAPAAAIVGRSTPVHVAPTHLVLGTPTQPPFPEGLQQALFGLGCFWGAERLFWQTTGVFTTAVGYSGGFTENPTYEEVCTARTGHAEVVLVVFDPAQVSHQDLLKVFFEGHDPTQHMRQGNDVGTQYRSAIFTFDADQQLTAEQVRSAFAERLAASGFGAPTTEITAAGPFYYAEDYHQQYLAKNPSGYCGLGGTGVSCPVGLLG